LKLDSDNAHDGDTDFIVHLLNYDGSRLVDFDLGSASNR